jgi:long-chain fatty acid transport protein
LRKLVLLVLGLFAATFANRADAAGFGIYEWSARGNALGGAMIARADDPSAVAFNPAGMVQLEGTQMMVGFTAISPTADLLNELDPTPLGQVTSVASTWFPPHLYYTRQIGEKSWFGIGVFTRFGLGTELDPGWFGRYNSYKAEITSVSINPSWAWKISEKWSAGVGIEAAYFGIDLRRKIFTGQGFDLDSKLEGDSVGWGWNLGLLYRPTEKVQVGLTYRSQINQKVEGDFDTYLPDGSKYLQKGASGEITLPDLLTAGILFKPTERLSLEVDAVLTRWSSYDRLQIDFEDGSSATSEKNWNDVWRYQLGIEYTLTDHMDLRLGYVIDPSPIPDETIDYIAPTNDRRLYSIGLGYRSGDWTYDLSYIYLKIKEREIAGRLAEGVFPGRSENGDAHLFGISLSRKF